MQPGRQSDSKTNIPRETGNPGAAIDIKIVSTKIASETDILPQEVIHSETSTREHEMGTGKNCRDPVPSTRFR